MDKITDQLLHFIKGVGPHAFSDELKSRIENVKNWCPFSNHNENDAINCYAQDGNVLDLIKILRRYQMTLDYIEDDPYHGNNINELLQTLINPEDNLPIKQFLENINMLISAIILREEDIYKNLKELTCIECTRLDEAITCQADNCFLATTVMSVSAIEARLHYLVKKSNRILYENNFEDATLGRLIELFDDDK